MRLLALGGCGGMGRFAVGTALADELWDQIVIADLDAERAEEFARSCDDPRVRALALNVTDEAALLAALAHADVVLAAVGPYYRFGVPILRAAIAAGCHYVDLNDDWEPTLEMLALDGDARAAGVTAIVGMGASPGISNLLALRAARELEQVETLHTVWGIGQQGLREAAEGEAPGRGGSFGAALEHWVQQVTGRIRVVADGQLVEARPLQPVTLDYPEIGRVTCHTVGHPEPVTLVRSFPDLHHAVNLMDLPAALIGLVRRVARRVDAGEWSVAEGGAHLGRLLGGGTWRLLLSSAGPRLLTEAVFGARHLPSLCALAVGTSAGQRMCIGAGLTSVPAGGMGGVTGVPAAIGLGMIGRGQVGRHGVRPPEEVVDADLFFKALAPHCPASGHDSPVRVVRAPAGR